MGNMMPLMLFANKDWEL